jgi:hypothetical protein
MAVTGLVLPSELETPAQNDFERYGGMGKGFEGRTIRPDGAPDRMLLWASSWGVGTNMAFRKAIFAAVGDFDVALDVGTPTSGGGDIEFFYRTVAAGYSLRYEPSALVHHTHRRDMTSLMRQIYNNGRSFPAYLLTVARRHPSQRKTVVWFGLRGWAWGWLLKRLIKSLVIRDRWTFRFALTELKGALSGPGAYVVSHRKSGQWR